MPAPQIAVGTGSLTSVTRRFYHEFRQEPLGSKRLGGAPTGTAGDRNNLWSPGWGFTPPASFEWHVKGTQTILQPTIGSLGLDINQDQTDNDGIELTQGITALSPAAFVVGTDGAFFFEVDLSLEDASGVDPIYVGFRKAEAYQADYNVYDELFAIGVEGTSNPNVIQIAKILNNAATSLTDTTQTWADAAQKKLRVNVGPTGICTAEINRAAPTVTVAHTFDTGEVVVPFVYFLNGADVAGAVQLVSWDCGKQ